MLLLSCLMDRKDFISFMTLTPRWRGASCGILSVPRAHDCRRRPAVGFVTGRHFARLRYAFCCRALPRARIGPGESRRARSHRPSLRYVFSKQKSLQHHRSQASRTRPSGDFHVLPHRRAFRHQLFSIWSHVVAERTAQQRPIIYVLVDIARPILSWSHAFSFVVRHHTPSAMRPRMGCSHFTIKLDGFGNRG